MKGFLPRLSGFCQNNLNKLICVYNEKVKMQTKVACVFKKKLKNCIKLEFPEGTDSFKLCVILWHGGGGGGGVWVGGGLP